MIDISQTAGGHTIQNNHFEVNPLDPRPVVSPVPPVQWWGIKNQGFLYGLLDTLGSNRISGNVGEGLIWTDTGASGQTCPCGLDLEENGIVTPGAQDLTSIISFLYALPAPPFGSYLVNAAFNWNAGAWFVTKPTQSGFTLNWSQAPAAALAPQIVWSAKFVAAGFSLSASPLSSIAVGLTGTAEITSSIISGSFSSPVALSIAGLPASVTASFSPPAIAVAGAASSTLTLSASSSAAPGSNAIVVTGTAGGVTQTLTLTLTITAAGFAIASTPSSVSIARGASGTTAIATTVAGGYNEAIALTAAGLPSCTTATFSAASIAAPGAGSSSLTMAVAPTAAPGSYLVAVTGTDKNGLLQTTTIALTIT